MVLMITFQSFSVSSVECTNYNAKRARRLMYKTPRCDKYNYCSHVNLKEFYCSNYTIGFVAADIVIRPIPVSSLQLINMNAFGTCQTNKTDRQRNNQKLQSSRKKEIIFSGQLLFVSLSHLYLTKPLESPNQF